MASLDLHMSYLANYISYRGSSQHELVALPPSVDHIVLFSIAEHLRRLPRVPALDLSGVSPPGARSEMCGQY